MNLTLPFKKSVEHLKRNTKIEKKYKDEGSHF